MKKNALITFFLVCFLAVLPPTDFYIHNPPNPYWQWMVMISGFLGFFTLFMKTDWPVPCVAIGGFINCFFSSEPYVCFSAYVSLVVCCYLYIFACRIKDWSLIFKGLQAVVILNIFMFLMQKIHHDPLLNFGQIDIDQYGVIGQHMQMGSFAVVLASFLLPFSKLNLIFPVLAAVFCKSSWTFLTVGIGGVVLLSRHSIKSAVIILVISVLSFFVWDSFNHKISSNAPGIDSGRMSVWQKSLQLSCKRPWRGYGIGSFKDMFHPLSGLHCIAYRTAHNFIVQLVFEIGYPAVGAVLLGIGFFLWALFKNNLWIEAAGLVMILVDAMVHFPDRMIQTVPLIIIFLAYTRYSLCQMHSSQN